MTKTGTSARFDRVLEPVVEVLDQAIEVDCRKLFESQDIEGLRRMRRKLGESAPESIDRYIDELSSSKAEKRGSTQGADLFFYEPEPWHNSVDGASVLTDIAEKLQQHMAMKETDTYAVALWIAHAHCIDAFDYSPRLAISAPAPQCGKTVLLTHLVGTLVPRPQPSELVTPAAFFRLVAAFQPTMLIDEVDSWLREDSTLPAAINAGFEPGGGVLRCQGDNHDVRRYSTFCPTALAGIRLRSKLPAATLDRSIVIELQRALAGEIKKPFNKRKHGYELRVLGRKLVRWSQDNLDSVKTSDPALPPGVMNRQADKWLPLFAIAEVVGGLWPGWAHRALLSESSTTDETKEIQLLNDIRQLFHDKPGYFVDVIYTYELIDGLCSLEDSYWKDYNFRQRLAEDRRIQPKQLARLLGDFGLLSASHRRDRVNRKGYRVTDLEQVINRYLTRHGGTSA